MCDYYALCENEPIGTTPHPILDAVPTCQRCADKHGLTIDPVEPEHFDVVGAVIDFENGDLDHDGTLRLFQHLVDTGMAWSLQGSYGRAARALIDAGLITE